MRRLMVVAALAACSDDYILPAGGDPPVITGTDLCAVESIFAARCLACHDEGALGDLDLATDPVAALVGVASSQDGGVTLVVPGDPDASLLYQKVTGSQAVGGSMPPGNTLSADEAGVIRAWISDGASGTCDDPIDTDGGGSYHPAGFADPGAHGQEAKLQTQVCVDCHGADLTGQGAALSCDTCHPAGWRADCTFCHGDPAEGTGAPPVHLSGVDDGADASFVPHIAHVQATSIKRAFDCVECHVKPTDALSTGHVFLGDATPGVAEVSFALSLSSAASWSGNGTCSDLYCHGNGRGDNGTIEHHATVSTCHDCHPDATSGDNAWDRMSGEHRKHLREGIKCWECHGDTTNAAMDIVGFDVHVNGQPDVAPRLEITRSNGRCSGTCHGEVHYNRTW